MLKTFLKSIFIVFLSLTFLNACSSGGNDGASNNTNTPESPIALTKNYNANYEYDELGRISKIEYENGQSVTYSYILL